MRKNTIVRTGMPIASRAAGIFSTRRVISSIVAATVAATSAMPAAAESYYFRYSVAKTTWVPGESPEEDLQLGVGNDITIHFAGAIGIPFSKVIPVRTKDVVDWRIYGGALHDGLSVNSAEGVVSGTPTGKYAQKKAVLHGYDVSGRLIARANVFSVFVNPVGATTDFTFYGHTNKYMYREIPATVPVARWVPVGELPEEFTTEGRFLVGTPTKEISTSVGFIGYDYMGKEVAFTYGDLIVQDNPVFREIPDLTRHPSKLFTATAVPQYTVGEMKYRLVALDGVPANSGMLAKQGRFNAYIPTFNTSMRFRIEGTDADGTVGTSNVFTFTTSAPDSEMSSVRDQTGTINKAFSLKLLASDLSGTLTWSILSGELPDGISLDAETGEISGYPTREETKGGIIIGVVTSDGGSAQTRPFSFTIYPEEINVTFKPVETRVGRPFVTDSPIMGAGIVPPFSFKVSDGFAVDEAYNVDLEEATVSGTPTTPGDHSIPFDVVNGDGRQKTFIQPITVHDNLGLQYDQEITVYRRVPADVDPSTVTGVMGVGQFELASGELPEGLTIDPKTGTIVGTALEMGAATDVSVTVTDESGESVTSNIFDIEVVDRPDVEVASSDVTVERFVDNAVVAATSQNAFDGVTYELAEGTLPEGLTFDEDGMIRGNTTEVIGVYEGLRVRATDGEGYTAVGPAFSVTLTEPATLAPLNPDGSSEIDARWVKESEFSFELPLPTNAYGNVSYEFAPLPLGVALIDDKLVGKIDEVGSYIFPFTMIDESRRTLSGNFNLQIVEPMTATLEGRGKTGDEENDNIVFELPRGGDTLIEPQIADAIGAVTYSIEGNLPNGLTYADGKITGKPATKGDTGEFTLTVTDEVGSRVDLRARIVVGDRVPLSITYNIPNPAGYLNQMITPIKPTVVDAVGAVSYTVSGEMPTGLQFDQDTGYFYGKPTQAKWFQGIQVTATDSEGSTYAGSYGPFAMSVSLPGSPTMSSVNTFIVRAEEPFERTLDVSNVLPPVAFDTVSGEPLPYGLQLSTAGKISGTLPEPGKYAAGQVFAADSLGREAITSVDFVAVGPVEIATPADAAINQYLNVDVQPAATNLIGLARYELVGGSLPSFLSFNEFTGKITGVASEKGTWGGLVVKVTDSTGSSALTNAFSITVGDRLLLDLNTNASYSIVANRPYNMYLLPINAVGKVTYSLNGSLPEGIDFDANTGRFYGYAVRIGTFPVTVTATDSVGGTVTKSFTFISQTNGFPIGLDVVDFQTRLGYPIQTAVPDYSNHIGDVQFWADETLAEHGLTIDPQTGVITGTASQLMDFTPNIHISDETLRVTSMPINIKVVPDLTANVPARIEVVVNKRVYPYIVVSADNGIGTLDWSIEGELPEGMNFSKTSKRFSGTPTEIGTFPLKLTVAERTGFMQRKTVDTEIVVVSDGNAPTVRVNPTSAGYFTYSNVTITPSYTNKKVGDVLTLAPDSAPLPPGFFFEERSGGYVLRRLPGEVADAGIYPGIKVRVTGVDGLYGDSDPFTIILKAAYTYDPVTVSTISYAPFTVPMPAPRNGAPIGQMNYSLSSSGYSWATVMIDPDTGVLTGSATRSGTLTIYVKERHNGNLLRSISHTVRLDVKVPTVKLSHAKQIVMQGGEYPNLLYTSTITNMDPAGVMSLEGDVPEGLVVDPSTGVISGVPVTDGSYSLALVYTDTNQRISAPFTLDVVPSVAAGSGYKFLKVEVANKYDHMSTLTVKSSNGIELTHLLARAQGNLTDTVYDRFLKKGGTVEIPAGSHQAFELPAYLDKGSISLFAHGHGATVIFSASVDGQNWVEIGRPALGSYPNTSTVTTSFQYQQGGGNQPEPEPSEPRELFEFNNESLPSGMDKISYSYSLRSLVDTGTLDGVSISGISWSWDVDPDRPMDANDHLPAGLSISNYTLRGTPTEVGTFYVVVTGTSNSRSLSKKFVLEIQPLTASVTLQGAALPAGRKFETTYNFDVKDYVTPVGMEVSDLTFAVSKPAAAALGPDENPGLPAGLSLQNGVITGTPSGVGKYRFIVTATWPRVTSGSAEYTVEITGDTVERKFTTLASAGGATCGVTTAGSVACWGVNGYSQLGDGSTRKSAVPVDVGGINQSVLKATKVAVADRAACALMENGSVKCWGNNSYGQTATTANPFATDVETLQSGVTDIAMHASHTCEVVSGGVKCHGWNFDQEAGGASGTPYLYEPTAVSGVTSGIKQVAVGAGFSCSLSTTGAPKCWGLRTDGRLGNGSTTASGTRTPQAVSNLTSGVKQIALGNAFACAITSSSGVKCWGANSYGQLGDNSTTVRSRPVDVNGLASGVKQISLGHSHACALMNAGTVKCWGLGSYGRLGDGRTLSSQVPVDVVGLSNVKEVVAGYDHTCALLDSGDYTCWGRNNNGQLGDGTFTDRHQP
jgi:Alpha-tubulin suppressor and related RCC1 domain-containing proteins